MSLRLFVFVFMLVSIPLEAADLKITSIDYGVPGNPFEQPVLPGEEGDFFLTFENPSAEPLLHLSLQPYAGDCVESIQEEAVRIDELQPGSSLRLALPLRARISSLCSREMPASFLLIGTYTDQERSERRIWSEAKFAVAPFPEVNFVADNLNLPIQDRQTVQFDFQVPNPIQTKELGVMVKLTHTYHRDLVITLTHPTGKSVTIFNKGSGKGLLELKLGLGGTATKVLDPLLGLPAQGKWTVSVEDATAGDQGSLQAVGLRAK